VLARFGGVVPDASEDLDPNAPLQLYQLDLDVLWKGGGHDYTAHFRTLRLASAGGANGPDGAAP
jgi:general secretion pathway protein I